MRRVFIDGCAINRFALVNVDPVKELAGSGFVIAITSDLEAEYRRAQDHLFVPPYVKMLLRVMLDHCERHEVSDAGSTDRRLVALAAVHVVITDDAKLYRRYASDHPGLVAWPEVEVHLRSNGCLADLVRERGARMADAHR